MEKIQNLIVGCGLSGVVLARKIAEEKNEKVLIIDRRDHVGGNVYDYKDKNTNITIHKYGPHVFHTSIKEVWDFLSRFTKWHYFFYKVKAYIDGKEVNIPFNLDSLYKVFTKEMALNLEKKLIKDYNFGNKTTILELKKSSDKDLQFLADYIYKKVFLGYTTKQWGVKPEEIDESVSARVPIYISKDDGYFQDKYQALPRDGYTKMIQNILDHSLIEVRLNTDFKDIQKEISYDKLFYTGAIDEFFNYKFGKLPYRSLDIKFETYDKEYIQSCAQMNYPNNFNFTRSVEYKYYLDEKSDKTILSYEYPCEFKDGMNERYYSIPNDENQKLYEKYLQEANKLENIYFLGRLGDYKYYDMDKAIDRILKFYKENL
ncbi:UDP-galactopyranose mutase [Campylobacter volucris]|uniref:UDP-galactopyranose mutase n=1 Tax=Campylobacter volucris TaxID=1031542 RepID=UPI00189FE51F|nr:UDP-galactopyranose mutase [Campylobacter volucris]MBF7048763.1 UDP-galactopyranose mutase [Campylobacter volucris]MBF7059297.1 UDP-galactopyranose mutase [Campylobacter volucris]